MLEKGSEERTHAVNGHGPFAEVLGTVPSGVQGGAPGFPPSYSMMLTLPGLCSWAGLVTVPTPTATAITKS